MLLTDGESWFRVRPDGTIHRESAVVAERDPVISIGPRTTKRRKRKAMAKAKKKKAHCKRVRVRKGSSKKRLMCWGANGKIVSAKRSKAGKKAARKRRR